MKVENTVKLFKEIHPETVLLIKVGSFFHAYGKDSYILAYLFGYQIKKIQSNYSTCGFPLAGKAKVIAKLEEMQISYLVINKADNYEVSEEEDYKTKNRYTEIFTKSHTYITKKNRIDTIYQYLLENIHTENLREKVTKVEEVIYETGKI